ncbi:MAG: phosphoenolpyruvate--protein phosphotransferase [Betaproteobacteria bacterium]|nr:phosphoenolpyruvate--protein phosphotransferase [Betaproteobacteria bacterium]
MSTAIHGIQVSHGIVIGRAVLLVSARLNVAHYFVERGKEEAEVNRLRTARAAVLAELDVIKAELRGDTPHEVAALIDVHKMLLEDESISHDTAAWIRERRYNAEWALTAQLDLINRQFDEMDDVYLRERKYDVEQVVERLLHALHGSQTKLDPRKLAQQARHGEPLVLVAHDIAPADMLQFKEGLFGGFVTDTGGPASHTAIVARSLAIPAVVAAREATRLIRQDDVLIVDADAGLVIVEPSDKVLAEYRGRQAEYGERRRALRSLKRKAAVTRDGVTVELCANIELPQDADAAVEAGADGVGLFRSEFLFMNRRDVPGEDEQFEAYVSVVRALQGKPVTIRTLDIGADKPLDSEDQVTAPNPALGLRAIRYSLAQPAMFQTQLRALLRASAFGPVKILVPMLAHASEITQTLTHVAKARASLAAKGMALPPVQVGAMVEIPAAALTLPVFVRAFDFLSLGTNDLIQYTLAIDRADESVASLYDPLHPAVLRLIADTLAAGSAAGKPVSLCGEMAGETRYTRLLLGLGLRSFSMHPSEILSVKQEVMRAHAQQAQPVAQQLLQCFAPEEREALLLQLLA